MQFFLSKTTKGQGKKSRNKSTWDQLSNMQKQSSSVSFLMSVMLFVAGHKRQKEDEKSHSCCRKRWYHRCWRRCKIRKRFWGLLMTFMLWHIDLYLWCFTVENLVGVAKNSCNDRMDVRKTSEIKAPKLFTSFYSFASSVFQDGLKACL